MKIGSIEHRLESNEQLCFIHIPKTAGTTFTSIIDAKFSRHEICPAQVWSEFMQLPDGEAGQYRLLRGHFYYYIHKFLPQKPTYITMLRDPIERIISAYEFMRRFRPSRAEGIPTHEKALALSLKEYVCDPTVPGIVNSQTRQISENFNKELPDFTHPKWLESAKENLEQFAFIGITEEFQQSMALLSYTFGWRPIAEYQNLMVAPKRLRQEDLSQDVIDAIAERNQLDIELYHYARQLFERRYTQMTQELVERFGDRTAAVDSNPVNLNTDLNIVEIGKLLDQHYEACYADTHPQPAESLKFTFDQAMSGSGWHLQEGDAANGTAFRWTGPGTVSTLDFPLTTQTELVLEFRVINAVTPDILESLSLRVNDHPVELITLFSEGSTTIFQATLSQQVLASDKPFTRIAFEVNRTVSPKSVDPTNPDSRPVGLAFNFIQFSPIQSFAQECLASFLFNCSLWQDTVNFVQQNLKDGDRILAPSLFRLRFLDRIGNGIPASASRTCNYNFAFTEKSDFQWIILHKGMKHEIGSILRKLSLQGFIPVFANEVFVVFSSHSHLPKLPISSPHVKALYIDQFKYVVQELFKPLQLRTAQLKIAAKDNLKPLYTDRFRPWYVKHIKRRFDPALKTK